MPEQTDDWWRTAVVYEIYPRSFADGNGDGAGDLLGATARLPHLAGLGVDAVWVAPWYPSPMADGGYDVSDYCAIHPLYGTLAEADTFLATARRLGLRVIVDIVANHSSEQHPWFTEALASAPGSRARQRYFFRDGRGEHGELPPNNWISAFGGIAWTRVSDPDGTPGQWYLHTFAPEQPDLNWEDERVRASFDDILRFWLDRGVDGFRVDAVPAMSKLPGLPDTPIDVSAGFLPKDWEDSPHWDTDGVHDLMRRWRRVLDEHGPGRVLVAEAVVNGPERMARYLRHDEMHLAFNFDYVGSPWDAAQLRTVLEDTLATFEPAGAPATWALSSHDEIRHVTRFGRPQPAADDSSIPSGPPPVADRALGTRRARASILLTLALPGSACLYQGEELGLEEVEDLPDAVLQDPVFVRSGGTVRGRDGCRVPLPWEGESPPFGFNDGGQEPWLPQPATWGPMTVAAQADDPASMLTLYRSALQLRRAMLDQAGEGLRWLPSSPAVLRFARGSAFECVVNLGHEPVDLEGEVLLASCALDEGGRLPGDGSAWLRSATSAD